MADRDGLTGSFHRRRMLELMGYAMDAAAQQKQRVHPPRREDMTTERAVRRLRN